MSEKEYKPTEELEAKEGDDEPIVDTDIPEIISAFNEFKRKYSLNF